MSTLTSEQEQRIRDWLDAHPNLTRGLGNRQAACSVAAINLALTGELTDRIPPCMSGVLGRWIVTVQDAMPAEIRQSAEWRNLLPLAAGTGRDREAERLAIILDHMWTVVLPTVEPVADARGFGDQWRAMCEQRTPSAAAYASRVDGGDDAAYAAYDAARAAGDAAYAYVASRVDGGDDAAYAVAADAVAADAVVAAVVAAVAAADVAWQTLNPVGLLRRLIEVSA